MFNHTTGHWGSRVTVSTNELTGDSHGTPAACEDYQGYVHVFFGSHLTASHYCVTTNPGDETAWSVQSDLNSTTGGVTYPHPVAVGSSIYLFFRQGGVGDDTRRLIVFKTTALSGGAATWSSETALIELGVDWCYQGPSFNRSGKIHFVLTRGDDPLDAFRTDVFYGIYNTADGSLKNYNESVSTASGSLPITNTTANTSYRIYTQASATGGIPSLAFDANGNPHVLYCNGNISGTMTLYHIALFSGSWTSPATLATLPSQYTQFSIIPGLSGAMAAYWPETDGIDSDGGIMKTASRTSGSGGTWGSSSIVRNVTSFPFNDFQGINNAHADLRGIYFEVNNNEVSATGGLKGYALGDRGTVGEDGFTVALKVHHNKQQGAA